MFFCASPRRRRRPFSLFVLASPRIIPILFVSVSFSFSFFFFLSFLIHLSFSLFFFMGSFCFSLFLWLLLPSWFVRRSLSLYVICIYKFISRLTRIHPRSLSKGVSCVSASESYIPASCVLHPTSCAIHHPSIIGQSRYLCTYRHLPPPPPPPLPDVAACVVKHFDTLKFRSKSSIIESIRLTFDTIH